MENKDKQPLIIISGPTAVGKTSSSIKLAKAINGSIISADSMQVYKGMDIGTAKITKEEMEGVKHYLIDCLDPKDEFNVMVFKEMALKAIEEIRHEGKIPIVVGGTGFYVQALLYDVEFTKTEDDNSEYRNSLYEYADKFGNEALHDRLKEVDPDSAATIHANNVKRVSRALEYFHQTGELFSKHNETQKQRTSPFNYVYFVLNDDRDALYERIDKRVDKMFLDGLVGEVEKLAKMGYTKDLVSMQGIGYKEILDYLDGKYSLEEAKEIIKRDTRRFAKRQLTWFRREKDCLWLDIGKLDYDFSRIIDFMMLEIKNRELI
ncbi:MAG: tRNA (adenosine(37)-N6)-dimethylallyltransferase MiaA [Lachnospira sp.]|nr:tRNA (adenosine(37)-N6)-dimethylallyltransferase MiaA [Lachnospira sp.]